MYQVVALLIYGIQAHWSNYIEFRLRYMTVLRFKLILLYDGSVRCSGATELKPKLYREVTSMATLFARVYGWPTTVLHARLTSLATPHHKTISVLKSPIAFKKRGKEIYNVHYRKMCLALAFRVQSDAIDPLLVTKVLSKLIIQHV